MDGGLWYQPAFRRLWLGKTVSQFGSLITATALPFVAILTLGASPLQVGLLAVVEGVPTLLIGLFVGVWVDRACRRPIIIAADLGRAALIVSIPIAALMGLLSLPQLYLVGAGAGIFNIFFSVADEAYLPTLVPPAQLVEANSRLSASASVAMIGGPALGGMLVQWFNAPLALLFDFGSFIFSAASVKSIRTPEPPPSPSPDGSNIWQEIGVGWRLVTRDAVLPALLGCEATFNFFGYFGFTLYNLYLVRELGLSPLLVGLSMGLSSVGSLVGASLNGRVVSRVGVGLALVGGLTLAGTALFLSVGAVGGPLLVGAMVLTGQLLDGIAIVFYEINVVSLRQSRTEPQLLGRVNACFQVVSGGAGPAGALLGGLFAEVVGLRLTVLVGILGIIAASLWIVLSPLGWRRQARVASSL